MAQRKAPRRTRERILKTSLALFNRFGEPNITTAHIADEMNISPGNLYYHFRNKDDIVGELYDALEAKLAPLFTPSQPLDVEELWLVLHLLFETMWGFRFFYRDVVELTSRNRRIGLRFARLTRDGESTVVESCRGLRGAGALHATDAQIAALARNVVIVATYWMSFQRTTQPSAAAPDAPSDMGLDRAANQVLSLLSPFTVGATQALIEALGERYL